MTLYNLFALCDEKGKFVYEVSDIFGDRLTVEEVGYWAAYNRMSIAKLHGIDVAKLSYEQVGQKIERVAMKRKAELDRLTKTKGAPR